MTLLKLKRAYDLESADDGWRVYVDRLWPQGLSHQTFHYDLWEKQISPSTELRKWFHADTAGRWDVFVDRYAAELAQNPAFDSFVNELKGHPAVTLLFSSRDRLHDNAVALEEILTVKFPDCFSK